MRGRVRRRGDGVVEIRRSSWRDVLMTRDFGIMIGLVCAWGVSTILLVIGLVASPLLVGAAGAVALALWASGISVAA